jgi:hypothetical protein
MYPPSGCATQCKTKPIRPGVHVRNFLQVVRPFGVESFLSYLHDYNYLTRAILAAAYDLVMHVGSHYFFVASSAPACHLVLTTSEMQSINYDQSDTV